MSVRARGAGRRVSWFLALVLLVTPVTAFAQQLPAPAPAPAAESTRSLVPLYVSFAVLQGLDVHSTTRALEHGAAEANPLMRGAAHQPAALIAVKAAGAASTIWLTEKLAKKHRMGAFILMAAVNSAYAMMVAHNYRAR